MNRTVLSGLLVAMLTALVLRCPELSSRPMHNDEAVNAVKLKPMMGQGSYRYDPNEHHGPTLYYAAWIITKILGVQDFSRLTESQVRAVTVGFGVGLIALLCLTVDGLGRGATIWAAMLTAVSPAMVFYSCYFIHEMLLVFFTLLALAAFWRHYRSGKVYWAVLCGIAVGLMQSTKETFVLSLAAAGAALFSNQLWAHSGDAAPLPARNVVKPLLLGLAAWLAVAVVFFSSFFTNARGVLDSIRTYLPWMERAAGASPHLHPWYYYLSRLAWFHTPGGPIWSEGFILAWAAVGFLGAFTGHLQTGAKSNFLRFVAVYTLALTLIYSAISYKTPWCLLNFWQGAIVLAGAGMTAGMRLAKRRWIRVGLGLMLLAGTGQLAVQARRASGPFSADRRNPYVYAQTSRDLLKLVGRVGALARVSPEKQDMSVAVCVPGDDYWPLPWYLRDLRRVGWFQDLPKELPQVLIVSPQFGPLLEERKIRQAAGLFELRPGVFLALYVEPELWQAYVNSPRPDEE